MIEPRMTLWVCVTCRRDAAGGAPVLVTDGRELFDAVGRLLEGHPESHRVGLRAVECMSSCERACTVAFGADQKCTYLFGDIDPSAASAEAIVSCAVRYAEQTGSRLRRLDQPEALRLGMLGRIPPL